jgi:hypothetical protein
MGAKSITRAKSIARGRFTANYDTLFKSSFLTNKSYGIEGECNNYTLEKEKIKIFILRCRKSPFLCEDFFIRHFFCTNSGGGDAFSEIKQLFLKSLYSIL